MLDTDKYVDAVIKHITPHFFFIDFIFKGYENKGRLILGNTSALIFALFLINVCSINEAGIMQRLTCFFLIVSVFFYTAIGIRLLAEAQSIKYPISFVFYLFSNICENIKLCIDQLRENKLPVNSAIAQIVAVIISISLTPSALADSVPSSPGSLYDPNSPMTETTPASKSGPIGEGTAPSKLAKVSKATYAKIPDSVKPVVDQNLEVISKTFKEAPAD